MAVTNKDTIEVKKDTERADAIRAIKLAWESAEPGRAAKARQSRLNYLSSHVVQVHTTFCIVARSCFSASLIAQKFIEHFQQFSASKFGVVIQLHIFFRFCFCIFL